MIKTKVNNTQKVIKKIMAKANNTMKIVKSIEVKTKEREIQPPLMRWSYYDFNGTNNCFRYNTNNTRNTMTFAPFGHNLENGATYKISLGEAATAYAMMITTCVGSTANINFYPQANNTYSYSTLFKGTIDTGWISNDYEFTASTSTDNLLVMAFKKLSGDMTTTDMKYLQDNVTVIEIKDKQENVYKYEPFEDFQQVEYLQSSGTQYIDTGIVPTGRMKVDIDLYFLSSNSPNIWLPAFGAIDHYRGSGTYGWETELGYSLYFRYLNSQISVSNNYNVSTYVGDNVMPVNTRTNFVYDGGSVYVNGTYVSAASTTSVEKGAGRNKIPIYLFTCYNYDPNYIDAMPVQRNQKFRIYKCKIYDNNGVLIRDFIPCYRKSDNVIGMYDLVNYKFYTNSGTGTFIKGSNV